MRHTTRNHIVLSRPNSHAPASHLQRTMESRLFLMRGGAGVRWGESAIAAQSH